MKIKNNPLDFTHLRDTVREICPRGQSAAFIAGYTDFTETFFESVISLSKIFYNLEEKTCDIDFEFSSMEANEQISLNAIKFTKEKEEYQKGALLAEFNSLQCFLEAYRPNWNKAA